LTQHDLKVCPEFFEKLLSGEKTFEIRKDDRGFRAGDTLLLREYLPGAEYTGRTLRREVTYLIGNGLFGVREDYVVMALGPSPATQEARLREALEKIERIAYSRASLSHWREIRDIISAALAPTSGEPRAAPPTSPSKED
jgi:uncharacterized protein DUF3850